MSETRMVVRAAFLVPVVIGASVLGACEDDSAGPERAVSVDNVAEGGIDAAVGREVTVSGDVSEIITPNAFWVGGDDLGDEALLVFSTQSAGVDEDDLVRITGIVKVVGGRRHFEDDFGFAWSPSYDGLGADGEHALSATRIEILEPAG